MTRTATGIRRFILALDSGQTLLVAHNIDIAPRVVALAAGTLVSFSGEYEWNSRGWRHSLDAS